MVRERSDWGYYVRAILDLTHPPSWRWRIIRRGNPMGVLLEAGASAPMKLRGSQETLPWLISLSRLNARNCGTTKPIVVIVCIARSSESWEP
jgi:hypothetical protein